MTNKLISNKQTNRQTDQPTYLLATKVKYCGWFVLGIILEIVLCFPRRPCTSKITGMEERLIIQNLYSAFSIWINSNVLYKKVEQEFGKCWFLWREENRTTRRKTLGGKYENQQQTQPTYDTGTGNRIQATLVEGKCSHHCAIPAPHQIFGLLIHQL